MKFIQILVNKKTMNSVTMWIEEKNFCPAPHNFTFIENHNKIDVINTVVDYFSNLNRECITGKTGNQ